MRTLVKHLPAQWPVIKSLGEAALSGVRARLSGNARAARPAQVGPPWPLHREVVPARPRDLIDDYLALVGGERTAYAGVVPPHLFPQWSFPLQFRALAELGLPIDRALNAWCEVRIGPPMPDDQPIEVSAQITELDDREDRLLIKQKVVSQTSSAKEALVVENATILMRGKKKERDAEKHLVPIDARRLATWSITPDDGMRFALLTGDFNPVHWVKPYARAFGFDHVIAHGFSTMARAFEGVVRAELGGDPRGVAHFGGRFTRPMVLPASVGLFIGEGDAVFVGDAPGTRAYFVGAFTRR